MSKQMEDFQSIGLAKIKTSTVIEVGEFAILWNAFEANVHFWYENNKLKQSFNDYLIENIKNHACQFKDNYKMCPLFLNLANELKNRASMLKKSIENFVRNGIFPNEELLQRANKIEPNVDNTIINFIESDGQQNFEGGLYAILQIRNNMFHGSKDYIELDKQVELFQTMNAILREVV